LLALTVAVALLVPAGPAVAKRKGAPATCEEARLVAVGRYAQRALKCHAGAAARGRGASPRCLVVAQARAVLAIQKFDPTGLCFVDPPTLALLARGEAFVEGVAGLLRPARNASPCAGRKLNATGSVAARLLVARALLTRVYDPAALAGAVAAAAGTIQQRFAGAERRRCLTVGDSDGAVALVEQLAGVAGQLRGQIALSKTIEFPAPAWPDVQTNSATFEALGFTVAMDGSSLSGVPRPGAGWLVVLGGQRARTDATGTFDLDVPPGSPVEGQLYHPSNSDEPMSRFLVTELGDALAPGRIDIELVTQGRCGMNVNPADDSAQCGAAAQAPRLPTPSGHDHGDRGVLNPDPTLYPPKLQGELGTYPNPDPAATQVACLDYDGFIQTGERGDTSVIGAVSYPGSTCYIQVEIGCCDNEAATIRRRIANLFDEKRFPVLSCLSNHLGRLCQQITWGDIAAVAKGVIAFAGQRGDVWVQAAEKPPVNVHNNGCFGKTHVIVRENGVGGVLVGPGFDGATLQHWDDTNGYVVDRQIQYWAPVECPSDPDAVDVFDFEVDGDAATLAFHCVGECPPPPGRYYSCTTTTMTTTTTTLP
jgi:hypothetical protein